MKWCWADVVFTVSAPVPFSSQPKKGFLGKDLVIFPTCEVGVAGLIPRMVNYKRGSSGPGIPLHRFSAKTQCLRSFLGQRISVSQSLILQEVQNHCFFIEQFFTMPLAPSIFHDTQHFKSQGQTFQRDKEK